MLADLISGTGPGTNPREGVGEIMSSESRHVRYRINTLFQLSVMSTEQFCEYFTEIPLTVTY